MTFSRAHFSTLIKYIGISFITGAIAHGFFSGTRSLLTGVFGIICFIIGTILEEGKSIHWWTILTGAMLAIGIGAVTGWLQHFPDSPERSVWIIPVGYILSIYYFTKIHHHTLDKKQYTYIFYSSILTLILSIGIFVLIENTSITGHSHAETVETTDIHSN